MAVRDPSLSDVEQRAWNIGKMMMIHRGTPVEFWCDIDEDQRAWFVYCVEQWDLRERAMPFTEWLAVHLDEQDVAEDASALVAAE
jgi:hypothetical protein